MKEEGRTSIEMDSLLMERIILILIAIELIVVLILKLIQISRRKSFKKEIKNKEQRRASILKKDVSYKKFLEISKRTSSLNSPVREKGDYFDFLFKNISSDRSLIENKIFFIDNEDNYE